MIAAPLEVAGYMGSKAGEGVYQKIISEMPEHRVYVEAFLGGGAIFRKKRPAERSLLIELNPAVAAAWARDLASSPEAAVLPADFIEMASLAVHGERIRNGTIGTLASGDDSGRRLSLERTMASPTSVSSPLARLTAAEVVAMLQEPETLCYCDPPYIEETRARPYYECEMLGIGQHAQLLELLLALPCRVMVSGYWHPLYTTMLAEWRSISFPAMTRGGVVKTEWLWMNFDPPDRLHDTRHFGGNFRERERIKRKKARWVARLAAMSAAERQIVLDALKEVG